MAQKAAKAGGLEADFRSQLTCQKKCKSQKNLRFTLLWRAKDSGEGGREGGRREGGTAEREEEGMKERARERRGEGEEGRG